MPRKACLLPACKSCDNVQFFRVPRNEQYRELWKTVLLPHVPNLSERKSSGFRCMYVCERHFEKKFAERPLKLKRYPTLFTDDEISTGIPTQSFNIQQNHDNTAPDHTYTRHIWDHNYFKTWSIHINESENIKQTHEKAAEYTMDEEINNESINSVRTCENSPNNGEESTNAKSDTVVLEPDDTETIDNTNSNPSPMKTEVPPHPKTTLCETVPKEHKSIAIKENHQQIKLNLLNPEITKIPQKEKAPQIEVKQGKTDILAEHIIFHPAASPVTDNKALDIELHEEIQEVTNVENKLTEYEKKCTNVEMMSSHNTEAKQTESEPINSPVVCKPHVKLMDSKLSKERNNVTSCILKEFQSKKEANQLTDIELMNMLLREERNKSADMEIQLWKERIKVTNLQNQLNKEQQKVTYIENQLNEGQQKAREMESQLNKEQQKATDMEVKLKTCSENFVTYKSHMENKFNGLKNTVLSLTEINKSLSEEIKQRNSISEYKTCVVEDLFLF